MIVRTRASAPVPCDVRPVVKTALARRTLLTTAAAALSLPLPFVRRAYAAPEVEPKGKMMLAWHTNIAARWLDPQQHDGTASPDNFLMALHDGADQELPRRALRPSGARRTLRVRRGRQERDLPAARRASSSMTARRSRRRTSNGATSTIAAPGARCCTNRPRRRDRGRPHRPVPLQGAVPRFPDPAGHRQCLRRRLGGAGEILREGRAGRVPAEADRRRPLQAGLAGAGREARVRGVRRLLPPGPHQAASRWSACRRRRRGSRCSSAAKRTSSISSPAN